MILRKNIFFLISITLILSLPSQAWREVGNGGNGYISEFFSIYDDLISLDKEVCYNHLTGGKMPTDLLTVRWTLQVKTRPTVEKDGEKIGALNYPDRLPPQLILSEEFWKNSERSQKTALVMHEILYLAHFDDSNMSFSGPILSCIQARQQETDMNLEVVKWAFRLCKPTVLKSLTRKDIEPVTKIEPDTQFPLRQMPLLEVSLNGLCIEGIEALDRSSLLNCGNRCKDWLCLRTNEASPTLGYNWTKQEIFNFLELTLKNFDKQTGIGSCGWEICDFPENEPLIKNFPTIKDRCTQRKIRTAQ